MNINEFEFALNILNLEDIPHFINTNWEVANDSVEFRNFFIQFIQNKAFADKTAVFKEICHVIKNKVMNDTFFIGLNFDPKMNQSLNLSNLLILTEYIKENKIVLITSDSYLREIVLQMLDESNKDQIKRIISDLNLYVLFPSHWSFDDLAKLTFVEKEFGCKVNALSYKYLFVEPFMIDKIHSGEELFYYCLNTMIETNPNILIRQIFHTFYYIDDIKLENYDSLKSLFKDLNWPYNKNIAKLFRKFISQNFLMFFQACARIGVNKSQMESLLTELYNREIKVFPECHRKFSTHYLYGMSLNHWVDFYFNQELYRSFTAIDIDSQLRILVEFNKFNQDKALLIPKIDSISEYSLEKYHRRLSNLIQQIDQPENHLVQYKLECIKNLDFEGFKIIVPETNYDLVDIGLTLDICVGSSGYENKILKKDSLIFILQKDNKPIYCIEIDYATCLVKQSKGNSNKDCPKELVQLLNSFLATHLLDAQKIA